MKAARHGRRVVLAVVVSAILGALAVPAGASAATYPPGFTETTVFSGLTNPTAVRFAPDGRVFVAEKSGLIKVFDTLSRHDADVFADLRTQVHNFWDRGLLGLALDPNFPTQPVRLRALHLRRARSAAPRRAGGPSGATSDGCPTPPGATDDGCVVSGRLSRLTASGNVMTGSRAGADRGLVPAVSEPLDRRARVRRATARSTSAAATARASTSPTTARTAAPLNPCGDPPGGVGATLTPPTAEGGALRSQDLRTPADPTGLDGAHPASRPEHRRGASGQPDRRQRPTPTRAGSSPTACATRSASRSGPARTRSGSATSAGTTGRRSTGSRTRPRRSRTSAGPATRAPGARAATTPRT